MSRKAAPQVLGNVPVLKELTYGSFDWDTHPIDTYDGPQGWGPFHGPWTPWDFLDPANDISYMYGSGESNEWQFAPDYDIITLFQDHSLDWVNNSSADVVAERVQAEQEQGYTSTIANTTAPQTVLARLRYILSGK